MPLSCSSVLLLSLLHAPSAPLPAWEATCEGRRRIELAGGAVEQSQEVCIGAGVVTSFVFDVPAVVDVEDETRFVEVTRGRNSVSVIPPRDLVAGERLRLTAHFGNGPLKGDVTWVLVAQEGGATHQVDVYWRPRSRDSLLEELNQERIRRLALQEEVARLRASPTHQGGLLGLITSGALGVNDIKTLEVTVRPVGYSEDQLTVTRFIRYRSDKSVAAQVWVRNSGDTPWSMAGASVIIPGEPFPELKWWAEPIAPNAVGHIVVELEARRQQARGQATLSLWGEGGGRSINIPEVTFPE